MVNVGQRWVILMSQSCSGTVITSKPLGCGIRCLGLLTYISAAHVKVEFVMIAQYGDENAPSGWATPLLNLLTWHTELSDQNHRLPLSCEPDMHECRVQHQAQKQIVECMSGCSDLRQLTFTEICIVLSEKASFAREPCRQKGLKLRRLRGARCCGFQWHNPLSHCWNIEHDQVIEDLSEIGWHWLILITSTSCRETVLDIMSSNTWHHVPPKCPGPNTVRPVMHHSAVQKQPTIYY